MKISSKIIASVLFLFCLFGTDVLSGAGDEEQGAEINHQRRYCAMTWNKYYKDKKIDISVTVEGENEELVVFTCPFCGLEDNYVEPFINTQFEDGTTNADRLRRCGFVKVKFKGSFGAGEVLKNIEG